MFAIRRRKEESLLQDKTLMREIFTAIAYSFFSATYHGLSSYRTENRVDRINHETNALASVIQEISATLEETASSFQVATTSQEGVNDCVAEGKKALDNAFGQLQISNSSISELSSVINNLKERVDRIQKAVDVITQVTEATHLLSLNASIEAARAGEHGRGFAVVADEIRKLAESTKDSATDIKESVALLNNGMDETLRVMNTSLKAVNSGIEASGQVLIPFEKIQENTHQMTELIEHLGAITQEQTAAVAEIAATSTTIADATNFSQAIAKDTQINVSLGREVTTNVWEKTTKAISLEKFGLSAFLALRVIDHALWIDKVVRVLRDQEMDMPDLADHHQCALGRWYYGEGIEAIKGYSQKVQNLFKAIEEPHKRVHQCGIEAVQSHRANEKDKAYEAVSCLTEASQNIIQLFVELMREVAEEESAI